MSEAQEEDPLDLDEIETKPKIQTHEHPNFGKGKHRVNTDAVNHELRRKLWEGQIPVKISLFYKDRSSDKEPRSLYMMAPRLNYFTYCLKRIKAHFDEFVPPDLNGSEDTTFSNMWIDFDGQPLKWDVPIGVQFDTYIGLGDYEVSKSEQLPWQLTFHYQGCPDDFAKLHKNGNEIGIRYIQFSYINSLKEAHVLRMGSANEILAQMKKNEETKLLDGIQKHSYELFWEINKPLCDKHIADMKKFALRINTNKFNQLVQPNLEIVACDMNDQKEVQQWEQDQYDITLGEVLINRFPGLFLNEVGEAGSKIRPSKDFDIVCHGLKVDLSTPLYWFQLNMSYLDNFIYLSFHSH